LEVNRLYKKPISLLATPNLSTYNPKTKLAWKKSSVSGGVSVGASYGVGYGLLTTSSALLHCFRGTYIAPLAIWGSNPRHPASPEPEGLLKVFSF